MLMWDEKAPNVFVAVTPVGSFTMWRNTKGRWQLDYVLQDKRTKTTADYRRHAFESREEAERKAFDIVQDVWRSHQ